ncbi:hypothetical protein J5N97_002268 [Dioscorea zingiberensis]|uniref:DNA-binding protein S1FA n=1 Tax=Dioscorea zingiberensis TaxID=325984 RepID=A0A9D5HQ90_9LILI|nr:hypothetical protein J5N97_002268 [Dioscorea zingiberensis]
MARGSSQSQTTASAGGAGRPGTVGPRGTPAATAGMRRRRPGGGGGGSGGFVGGGGGSNMLRFYTDDAPGLKMSPTVNRRSRKKARGSSNMASKFADGGGNMIVEEAKGINPGLVVLLVVVVFLLLFIVGNYALYAYAQKTLPPKKKKPISKKKMKKERLKQGVSAPGE